MNRCRSRNTHTPVDAINETTCACFWRETRFKITYISKESEQFFCRFPRSCSKFFKVFFKSNLARSRRGKAVRKPEERTYLGKERERERVWKEDAEVTASRFAIWRPCPGIWGTVLPGWLVVERHWRREPRRGPRSEEGRLTAARASPPKSMAGTG